MKIICTQEEKEQLIMVAICSSQCPFAETKDHNCDGSLNCRKCIEEGLEWEIKEEG